MHFSNATSYWPSLWNTNHKSCLIYCVAMEAIKILWYFEPSKIDQQLRRPRPHVGRSTSLHNFMRIFCSFWFYFNLQFYKLLTALTQRSSPMGYNKGKQSKCYILYKKNTHLVHAVCNILTTLFSISLVARDKFSELALCYFECDVQNVFGNNPGKSLVQTLHLRPVTNR